MLRRVSFAGKNSGIVTKLHNVTKRWPIQTKAAFLTMTFKLRLWWQRHTENFFHLQFNYSKGRAALVDSFTHSGLVQKISMLSGTLMNLVLLSRKSSKRMLSQANRTESSYLVWRLPIKETIKYWIHFLFQLKERQFLKKRYLLSTGNRTYLGTHGVACFREPSMSHERSAVLQSDTLLKSRIFTGIVRYYQACICYQR